MAPITICADGLRLSVRRCGHQVAALLCDLLDAVKVQLLVVLVKKYVDLVFLFVIFQ